MGSGVWWQLRWKIYICGEAATTSVEPSEPSEPVEPAEPLLHVIKGQHAPRSKFESRNEWLWIRDWGLGVTGD